ncbi:hypothetical protein B296_00049003 [Ensete ventricosum]|uniref:Uncharacterized protein n=1 Tax=Ensete ventricosum TaxID=4639 RepID=A0A426Y2F6_ENSVE|nr:hypothetical protein B296_00049003 [Ensete ventricosum]
MVPQGSTREVGCWNGGARVGRKYFSSGRSLTPARRSGQVGSRRDPSDGQVSYVICFFPSPCPVKEQELIAWVLSDHPYLATWLPLWLTMSSYTSTTPAILAHEPRNWSGAGADPTEQELGNLNVARADPTKQELGNWDGTRVDLTEYGLGNSNVVRTDPTEQELGNWNGTRADLTEHGLGNWNDTRANLTEHGLENWNGTRVDMIEQELKNLNVARAYSTEQELGNLNLGFCQG